VVLKVLDQKLRSVGWNRPFMAEEAEATVFGSLAANNIQKALKRIFLKMRKQNFNCLEVTKMVENRFLGVPYITVCTPPSRFRFGRCEGRQLTDGRLRRNVTPVILYLSANAAMLKL